MHSAQSVETAPEQNNQYLDDTFNAGDEAKRPSERIQQLRKELKKYRFSIDTQRARLLCEADVRYAHEPQIIRCAKSLAHMLENISIHILDGELIVGHAGALPKHGPVFPEFSIDWILDEMENQPFEERPHDRYYLTDTARKELRQIHRQWHGRTVMDQALAYMTDAQRSGTAAVGKGIYQLTLYLFGGVGHVVPNCERIFEIGWKGRKASIEEKLGQLDNREEAFEQKQMFYQAALIVVAAVIAFIQRYARLAETLAARADDVQRRDELSGIAANCHRISEHPPETFHEALQLWYFVCHITLIESNGHSISYGRFDQYMHPYYERDIAAGRLTKAQGRELVYLAMIKVQELMKIRDWTTVISNAGRHVGGSCFTLGGQDQNGNDATNDITHFFLDAIPRLYTLGVWNAFRVHPGTPDEVSRDNRYRFQYPALYHP